MHEGGIPAQHLTAQLVIIVRCLWITRRCWDNAVQNGKTFVMLATSYRGTSHHHIANPTPDATSILDLRFAVTQWEAANRRWVVSAARYTLLR